MLTSKGREVPLSYCGTTLDEDDADPLVPFLASFTAVESSLDDFSSTAWRNLTTKVRSAHMYNLAPMLSLLVLASKPSEDSRIVRRCHCIIILTDGRGSDLLVSSLCPISQPWKSPSSLILEQTDVELGQQQVLDESMSLLRNINTGAGVDIGHLQEHALIQREGPDFKHAHFMSCAMNS